MITVERLRIVNFKCFKKFEISFNDNINIIVGNNEEGKSTILEALHLALSGMLNGKSLFGDISESLFNRDIVNKYITSLTTETKLPLPKILIELYLKGEGMDSLKGDDNTFKEGRCGIGYRICFDEQYQDEYQALIQQGDVKTLPVEYYKIERFSFARSAITNKIIPLKSAIIDSSSYKYQNGSDVYISKIIRDNLEEKELTALSQSYRKLKEEFGKDPSIEAINSKIYTNSGISDKDVRISVDMSVKNSWDALLMTYIDGIPFQQIGKGEQCIIKTNLALAHDKAQTSNLILIEEPENHLSHSNLNVLLNSIIEKCKDKQLIITTHSNFVANKLRLDNLILLSDKRTLPFLELSKDDALYFQKLPGYDTLRLVLSHCAILVEGPSDELIIQRAFKDKYGVLPIEKGVDVISVRGLSFKRFLEISTIIRKKVAVVTDNDGDYENSVTKKYEKFKDVDSIKICASNNNELTTLEPQFVDANRDRLDELRQVLNIEEEKYPDKEDVSKYMINNKTDWALSVFSSNRVFNYPEYIKTAVEWICEEDGE